MRAVTDVNMAWLTDSSTFRSLQNEGCWRLNGHSLLLIDSDSTGIMFVWGWVFRLDTQVILIPRGRLEANWPERHYGRFQPESVLIEQALWDDYYRRWGWGHFFPSFEAVPQATRADLLRLWILESPECFRGRAGWESIGCCAALENPWLVYPSADLPPLQPEIFRALESLLRRSMLAADVLDTEAALREILTMVSWLGEHPNQVVRGRIVPIKTVSSRVVTLYLDISAMVEWRAFALNGKCALVFGQDWMFLGETGTNGT
jgi:hypothetical protein